jgi:hypothetical protein
MEPKLNCSEVRESLPFFIDSSLDDVTIERVSAHLASCSECRGENESLARLMTNMTTAFTSDVPEHDPGVFLDEVRRRIRCEKRRHVTRTWIAAAAAIVFTVGLGLFSLMTLRTVPIDQGPDMVENVEDESMLLYAARQFFDGFELVEMELSDDYDDTYDEELLYSTTYYTDLTMIEVIQALDTDTVDLVLSKL